MTLAAIRDQIQVVLNDPDGAYYTDTLVEAAINRANAVLSVETQYLGVVEATITCLTGTNATASYAMPTLGTGTTEVGRLFDLTEDPIWDATTPIKVTDEDFLYERDQTWRTKTTSGAPEYCVVERGGSVIRFYPEPTTATDIVCAGHAVHCAMSTTAGGVNSPLMPTEFHPVLVYEGALEAMQMSGETPSAAGKAPWLMQQAQRFRQDLVYQVQNSEVPRLIRGSREGYKMQDYGYATRFTP